MLNWQVISEAKYQISKRKKQKEAPFWWALFSTPSSFENSSHVDNWEALSFLLNQEGSAFGQVKTG